jgi:hypothetical protein
MNLLLLIADGISALVLGPIVMPVMIATQSQAQVCEAMKGTYNPKAVGDKCPDGHWSALVPLIREAHQDKVKK